MRSWLFAPADDAAKRARALDGEADIVILDLEDSVAPARKGVAREGALEALRASGRRAGVFVRINPLGSAEIRRDLEAVLGARPDGLVLPKSFSGASVRECERLAEEAGHPCPPILAIATESAAAMFGLDTYGGHGGALAGLSWGAEDLSASLGATTSRDACGALTGPFELARSLTLLGAAAAGVPSIDTVHTAFRDLEDLRLECLAARRDGFSGKLAIHPAQIPVINHCFTPSEEEVSMARRIVETFDLELERGVVAVEGQMLDAPHLARARALLERARRADGTQGEDT